jgi:hypothetical protein
VWSQGQILPPEAALAVQMIEAEKAATHFPIVISHDCDLAAAQEKEPHVEILIGRSIAKLGAASNALPQNYKNEGISWVANSGAFFCRR